MKARLMRENRTGRPLVNAACVMLAVAAFLLSGIATASAQERPRTLFDLLFGSRQAQPQRQYQQHAPQRASGQRRSGPRPPLPLHDRRHHRRRPRQSSSSRKPDAKRFLLSVTSSATVWPEGLDVAFASDPDLRVVTRINGSSGFVRNDHFDWPDNIGKILTKRSRQLSS